MEVLARYGTPEQKAKYLVPLLNGECRSAFLMTEPAVASSDATNIESSIRSDGDHYVINGRKWWSSGAMDKRCRIAIFMGKSDPGNSNVHAQQSMVIVPMGAYSPVRHFAPRRCAPLARSHRWPRPHSPPPSPFPIPSPNSPPYSESPPCESPGTDTPGIRLVRPLTVFGYDDAPHGHAEVEFVNVRIPKSLLLLGEGRGFEISQGRLGPGRIHHCMRSIGLAERALAQMVERATSRRAFNRYLAEQGTVQRDIADSRIELDSARLLVLHAAHKIDLYGAKGARAEIAMIKVLVPSMALRVLDRAIQVHGGGGVSDDFFLARAWAGMRTLRIADGPDEVHRVTVAKQELRRHLKRKQGARL